MISQPKAFDLKIIDKNSQILTFKDMFVSKLSGEIGLNYRGKDIQLSGIHKNQLSEAFSHTTNWQLEDLTRQLDNLMR